MKSRAGTLLHVLVLTIAFPIMVSTVAYYGFGTNYTGRVFHERGFRGQYEQGVYRYRMLGRALLLETYQLVKTSRRSPPRILPDALYRPPIGARILDQHIDPSFYVAYFVQNTAFMSLACLLLYLLLVPAAGKQYATVAVMLAALLMGLTQYIVCPYDMLSHALLLLSFWLIARPFRYSFFVLVPVVVLGTLTRETSALTLSFFFAWHYPALRERKRAEWARLALLLGVFLATYVALRMVYGGGGDTFERLQLAHNLSDFFSLIGLLALPAVAYLLSANARDPKTGLRFLLASTPYLLSTITIAITWEIRLWVPVWLGVLCAGEAGAPSTATEGMGSV